MFITREKILFIVVIFLTLASFMVILFKRIRRYDNENETIVFDFENIFSKFPFETKAYNQFLYIKFYKNIFSAFYIKHFLNLRKKVFITDNFKKYDFFYGLYEKSCNLPSPCFEEYAFNNLKTILKSLRTDIKSICICSLKYDERLKAVIDVCTCFCDKIFLSTDDIILFDKINSYAINKSGIGLLYKNISSMNDCDVIIILNEGCCDFYNKGRYVINLMKNHYVSGCNVLYDFYDKNCCIFENIAMKKYYFNEKNAVFFKLQWKIMKKS